MNAVLDRLARLDESGQRAVHRPGEAIGPRQQQVEAARDQNHHRRRNARIGDVAASRTLLRALTGLVAHRRAAAAAEAVAAVPLGDLERPARQRELRLRQLQEQRAQSAPLPAVDVRRVAGDMEGDAIGAAVAAQIVANAVDAQPDDIGQRRQGRRFGRPGQYPVVAPDEANRVARELGRHHDAGLESGGCIHQGPGFNGGTARPSR